MVLVVALGIVLAVILCYLWVKAINWMFRPLLRKKPQNPYILAHRMRRANDKLYEDYLDWLDKTGGDLPIEKLKTQEEIEFERKLGNELKR